MKKTMLLCFSFVLLLGFALEPRDAKAFEIGPLDASCYLRNQTWIRAWHGPDDIMQSRNEFNLELAYNKIPHVGFFLQLRPFYDTVFDWSNKGTGAHGDILRDGWAHNLGRNNSKDPLIREAYVDITVDTLFLRIGKQIVSWGKSDGMYMLDVVNPFNLRNATAWEEEDYKIPLWMLNANYGFKLGDLQVLYIFNDYQSTTSPGIIDTTEDWAHDWTFNTVGFANSFGSTIDRKAPANTFENSKWGLRWSGKAKGFDYTLNYFYTWSDYSDWPGESDDVWTSSFLKRRADRLSIYGFSVSRYWEAIDGVTRLEWAYTQGQPFYLPDTNLEEKDQIGYMFGYDRWVHTDWLLGFQLQQLFILDPVASKNAYIGYGATEWDFVNNRVANGTMDPIRTQATCYLYHDGFFPGDTGHFENLVFWSLNEGTVWTYTQFKYDITTQWQVGIGMYQNWGNEDDTYGQFHDNDAVFFTIKWGFM